MLDSFASAATHGQMPLRERKTERKRGNCYVPSGCVRVGVTPAFDLFLYAARSVAPSRGYSYSARSVLCDSPSFMSSRAGMKGIVLYIICVRQAAPSMLIRPMLVAHFASHCCAAPFSFLFFFFFVSYNIIPLRGDILSLAPPHL